MKKSFESRLNNKWLSDKTNQNTNLMNDQPLQRIFINACDDIGAPYSWDKHRVQVLNPIQYN